MLLQNEPHKDDTLLQGPKFGSLHNTEVCLVDMTTVNAIEIRIRSTEIVNPNGF
jgi:hypothetical protein